MSFAQPHYLYIYLSVPLIVIFWLWRRNRYQAAWGRMGDRALMVRLSEGVNWNGRWWQTRLWFLALLFIIFALARPQWGSEIQEIEQEGIQLMVALDISESMMAQDLKPDRLSRAKQEIVDLMNRLEGDEIGLVLFSGASFIQFPLTSDYDTARAFLANAHPGLISRPGTVIGRAIQTANGGFDLNQSNQKVIIVMTDGEDHETDPVAMAKEVAGEGVLVYTIGFGSVVGEPIPEYDAQQNFLGYKKDKAGAVVLSKLNEVALQQIAQAGNGRYFRATAAGDELDVLVRELDQLETAQLESRFELQKVERYQLFLLLALLGLFIYEAIPDRIEKKDEQK